MSDNPAADGATETGAPSAPERASLGRSSLAMSLGTAASRASGLVRTMLLVGCVGTLGTVADAFDIANKLPNMLFALIAAGVLQSVLVPQILKAMQAHNAQERLDKLLSISGLGLLVGTVVLVAAAPVVVHLYTLREAWTPEARQLATVFALWCLPQVFFYGLYTLLGQVLNARGRFAAYGWAPVANNVVSLIGFGAFLVVFGRAPEGGMNDLGDWTTTQTVLLGATATLGIAVQALLLIVPLRRSGFTWRFRLGLRGIGLRSAGKVVGWTLGAVALEQVGVWYMTNMLGGAGRAGSDAGEAVAGNFAYTNAMTIYLLPHSLVVVSIVTVLFPRMTAAVHRGDLDAVRRDMSVGLRSAGVFSVFSAAALLVLAQPLTRSLLPIAGEEDVAAVAPILQAMALGVVGLGATVMVRRMYFAFEDGRSIFVIQVIATATFVAALVVAGLTLPVDAWAIAAGGAYALSTWISVLLRIRGMRRKLHGIDGHRVLRLYVRAGLAAAVAGGLGWLVVRLMDGYDVASWPHALGATAAAGVVMTVVYLAGLKLLRVRELDDALAPILRRVKR
ncbi:murein biosynthesis integral membrane protein MurJ [Isoptericola variabilis]|uniref:Integral membrane protein MviN n=1 Tax=Isoptericola variabilis (strain 225) TaxID=743718 RepID=F6FWP5_ISOV2|nr:lipid II flippase MurJ [Isoptericola variabilis]AEG45686.1 integral membrane protein MviN [Isoptericola variabilis 225]TWH33763.1 putative peptidoglycan lipid II flippase [Isoptericola variabilis J7]